MEQQKPSRSILPKPPRSDLPPLAQSKYKHKREVVPVACDRCRARKIKCNGEKPACHACIRVNHECNYQEPRHREKKTKPANKKTPTRDAPKAPNRTLEWDANAIFERLDSGRSFSEDGASSSSGAGFRQESLHTNMIDATQGTLPISKWISLSSDDALTTHLLSLFWAYDTCVARIIQQDKFSDSLCFGKATAAAGTSTAVNSGVRGQVDFCSEILVHSLLAVATLHWSNSDGWDHVAVLGKSCAQHSAYLLKTAALVPTLSIFQSTVALWMYEHTNSNVEGAEALLNLSLQLYDELQEVWCHPQVLISEDPVSQSNYQVVSAAVWGFYLLSLKFSLCSGRFRNIPRPKLSPGTEFETADLASSVRLWLQSREMQIPYATGLVCQTVQLAGLALETLLQAEVDNMLPFPDPAKAQNLYNRIWVTKNGIGEAMIFHPAKPPLLIDTCVVIDLMALKLLRSFSRFRTTEFACKQTAHILETQHGVSIVSTLWDYRVRTGSHLDTLLLQACYEAVMTLLPQVQQMEGLMEYCSKACKLLHEMRHSMPIVEWMLGQLSYAMGTKGQGSIPAELQSVLSIGTADQAPGQFATGSGGLNENMSTAPFDSFFPM